MLTRNKTKKIQHDKETLLENFPSSSRFAESYRTLRTNLFFTVMEKDLKAVVMTSAVESEGKSTTSINLAYTIAQAGRRVLLMDMDLRRPHLSSLYGLRSAPGITNIIADSFGTHLTQGRLEDFSINDLIQLTRLQNRTCRLDVEDERTQVSLFFEKGRLTDLYWKNRPEGKKLANTLIRNKLLTEAEANLALGHQKKSVQRLGTILYTLGFVAKKDISKALSVHTIEAVKAVSGIETGHFAFAPLSSDEIKQSLSQKIDFERLFGEFNLADQGQFIKKAIDSAICETGVDNLYVLPSGPVPPNPAEMSGSQRTRFLIEYLKNEFDFIIIDTPPVIPATDALLIAPATDGTILVIKSGNTDRKIVKEAAAQFENAHQPIIGTVLNRVNMNKEGYYRYYKKYYSSYYGSK